VRSCAHLAPTLELRVLAQTQWEDVDRARFIAAWRPNSRTLPELPYPFEPSHVVTGLLLSDLEANSL